MKPKRDIFAWYHPGLRVLWCLVLAGHAGTMTAYWWPKRPHGFPVTHLKFWVNEALPWVLSAFCLVGIILAWRRRNRLFSLIVLTIPIAYASAALAGLMLFPRSATRDLRRMFGSGWPFDSFVFQYGFWLPLILCAVLLGLLAGLTFWRQRGTVLVLSLATGAGIGLGLTFVWAQRAADPSTCPAALALPLLPPDSTPIEPDHLSFGTDMTYDRQKGTVQLRHGGLVISVRSTLIFPNISLERCWTMFAPREWFKWYEMHLASAFYHQDNVYFTYEGRNQALVRLNRSRREGEPVEIETWTHLPEPVFSHQNSFAEISVRGYRNLSISLSPFPEERFALRPHSHPVGWIDQGFAFLDAHGGFHWAKGTREEKGPFQYLAHGRLTRGDPVILTLFDENCAIYRITLYDWSQQASVALSPTAGWGVPANAITTYVGPASSGNTASIDFDLAATHIGSGHETVGHRAGAYHNRIKIELLGSMTQNTQDRAADHREAFLSWARRATVPLPASPEEPLGERAQVALDRMLQDKRFVFLGEPEHCIAEKYPFRLLFIQYLLERGWRHVGMETGRSVGWRVDRYLATGDTSHLSDVGVERLNPQDRAIHGKTLEFIDQHEGSFHEQLRRISASRAPDTPRLHYSGYDLDLGMPLGAVEPIRRLLEGHTDRRVQELLNSINTLAGLSVEEQLARIEALQSRVATCEDVLPGDVLGELRSWLRFLHDSVAAEQRPRMTQDRRGHHLWRGQREHSMMQYLDTTVDALGRDEKLILMGHNGHLSKDAVGLRFRPQLSRFWGWHSWLRALGYEAFSRLTRCPLDIGTPDGSVGSHLCERFPGEVLSIWMLYGQGTLMMPAGPRTVRLHGDTIESLLAQVGDRFFLPLSDVDPQAKGILSNANLRTSWGYYASADLTAQADAIYFVRDVNAE